LDASPLNTAVEVSLERARTSPITVSLSGAPGYVVSDIQIWPKTLRVFHFECEPSDQYQMLGRMSSADVIKPPQHCRREIREELSVRCSVGIIRFDILITERSSHKCPEPNVNHEGPLPKLFEVLPPSLEETIALGD